MDAVPGKQESSFGALRRCLPPIIIIAAATVAYFNSFSGDFLFDDANIILSNRNIFSVWPPWRAVRLPSRWLADISFALNYATGGFNPADYHATNLLIHTLAALFLYGVVGRTLGHGRFAERFRGTGRWIAMASAALWAVHPVQTQSVTYVCQRYESMMGMLYLLTLYLFIRGAHARTGRWWLVGSLAAFVAGTGTKVVIATAPLVLVLYDLVFVSASARDMFKARRWFYAVLLAILVLPAVLWIQLLSRNAGNDVRIIPVTPVATYLLTQTQVVLHYIRLAFVPYPLVFDYRWPLVSNFAEAAVPAAIVGLLVAATLIALARRNAMGFLGAWFFLILAPTSSVVPRPDAAVEHRMYLSLAAVVVPVVCGAFMGLRRVADRFPRRGELVALSGGVAFAAVLAVFTGLTVHQNSLYASAERMWADVVKRRPDNWRAHFQLCAVLFNAGKHDAVVEHCSALLKRLPDFGNMELMTIVGRGKGPGGEEFLARSDAYARAQDSLGCVAHASGDPLKAAGYFAEAVRVGPGDWNRHVNLGVAYYSLGKFDRAVEEWTIASKLPRHDDTPYFYLGTVNERMGNAGEALRWYRKALWARPNNWLAEQKLAWILATCTDARLRDGQRAVKHAESACEAAGSEDAELLGTLAAACAECGWFDKAVQNQRRALELLRVEAGGGSVPPDRLREHEHRLELYLRKEPCRAAGGAEAGLEPAAP